MPAASPQLIKKIRDLASEGASMREIVKTTKCGYHTVKKYLVQPIATKTDTPIANPLTLTLPPSIVRDTSDILLTNSGWWGILSDLHIPFHVNSVIELFAERAKKYGLAGIIINGDLMDCLGLSSKFHKKPDAHTFKLERDYTCQFLDWLRFKFPKIPIIYKLGNHEERLERYIAEKAPELFELEEFSIDCILDTKSRDIQVVKDQRLIILGALPILHGHEYRSGITAPVNPARGAFLRASHTILVGHSHRTSEHHERDVKGKPIATWSTGCCCDLKAHYDMYNKWNHGFAFVEVMSNKEFSVTNLKVLNGSIV